MDCKNESKAQREKRLMFSAGKRVAKSKNKQRTINTWFKHAKAFVRTPEEI